MSSVFGTYVKARIALFLLNEVTGEGEKRREAKRVADRENTSTLKGRKENMRCTERYQNGSDIWRTK
jgi:hypothetical protein